MCSLCGALCRGPAWEQDGALGESARWQLRREAMETARALTAFLSASRIKVTAQADRGFAVAYPTGGADSVAGLADLWHLLARRKVRLPPLLALS